MTRNKPDKPRSDRKHAQQHDALKAVAPSMDPVADASIDSFPQAIHHPGGRDPRDNEEALP